MMTATPLLPSALHGQICTCNSCHDMEPACDSMSGVLVENKNNRERYKLRNHKKCSSDIIKCRNCLDLANNNKRKHRVTFSDLSEKRCSDDLGFCSSLEGNISHLLQSTSILKDDTISSESNLESSMMGSFKNNKVGTQKEDIHDLYPLHRELLNLNDLDSQSTTHFDLKSTPCLTLTCVSTHGVTMPLDSVVSGRPNMYVVLPFFANRETLTRRQLFQLAAMMAVGFIFVILILAWVFSPVLF